MKGPSDNPGAAPPLPVARGPGGVFIHPRMRPLVDEQVVAFSPLTNTISGALREALAGGTGGAGGAGGAAELPPGAAALAGSAALTAIGAITTDVDIDAPLLFRMPAGTPRAEGLERAADDLARVLARFRDAVARRDGVRFLCVHVVARPGTADGGAPVTEWPDPAHPDLPAEIRRADRMGCLLLTDDPEEPMLVDLRVQWGYAAPRGGADLSMVPGAMWFGHVAYSRRDAERFAAFERSAAAAFPDRYDAEATVLGALDETIADCAAKDKWLKVAKVLPYRAAWTGETAVLDRLPELLTGPVSRAYAESTRTMTALHLHRRGELDDEAMRAIALRRLERATDVWRGIAPDDGDLTSRLAALRNERDVSSFVPQAAGLVEHVNRGANDHARTWLAALHARLST